MEQIASECGTSVTKSRSPGTVARSDPCIRQTLPSVAPLSITLVNSAAEADIRET